jgi:mono/diheme cytochrome c family protein
MTRGRVRMRSVHVLCLGLVLAGTSAGAQSPEGEKFSPEHVSAGGDLYAVYCQPCHGPEMEYPGGSFDLRKFPPGQYARFETAVSKGKNNMPPWGEVLPGDDIKKLWAYVMSSQTRQ